MLTHRRVRFADLPEHIRHARELLLLVEAKIPRDQIAAVTPPQAREYDE